MAGLVRTLKSDRGPFTVSLSGRTLRIAASPSEIERLAHIIREVDDPETAGQRIWSIHAPGVASGLASMLDALVERDRGWPDGVKIPKIIPDNRGHRVIILADETGYLRIKHMLLERRPDPRLESGPIELPIGPAGR